MIDYEVSLQKDTLQLQKPYNTQPRLKRKDDYSMHRYRSAARIFTGILFILAGLNHFRSPQIYRAIMPDYLPWHGPLVALSGVFEVALGALALVPRWQRPGGWGLITLLVAIFPANLYMAQHTERYAPIPAWLLWIRLPLQGVLMAWVHWCTTESDDE